MAVTPVTQRTQDSVASVQKADPASTQHAALEPGSCRAARDAASAALHARQPVCQLSQTAACTQRQSARCKRRSRQQVSHQHLVEAYVAQVQMELQGAPELFASFLELVHQHQARMLSGREVAQQVRKIFRDHPELQRGYSVFMSALPQRQGSGCAEASTGPPHHSLGLERVSAMQNMMLLRDWPKRPPRVKQLGAKSRRGKLSQAAGARRRQMVVVHGLNRRQYTELQRGLKRQGVVVKTWQQFADRAVLKKRGSHFPWWTCLMTYTLCIIFFFMAGAYPAHLLLSTELQGVSSAGAAQMASIMQVSAQAPAAALGQAEPASAQLYTGSTLGEVQASGLHSLVLWFAFRPGWRTFDSDTLVAWGGRSGPLLAQGQWWRWATTAIVHTGFQHLMGNLVLLVALAGQLECAYGGGRVAAVCLVAAAGASLTSGAFEDPCTVVVGASGIVFGLMGLYAGDVLLNFRCLTLPWLRLAWVTASCIYFIVSSVLQGNSHVSSFSHLGGFICGLVPAFLFLPNLQDKRWRAAKRLARYLKTPTPLRKATGTWRSLTPSGQEENCRGNQPAAAQAVRGPTRTSRELRATTCSGTPATPAVRVPAFGKAGSAVHHGGLQQTTLAGTAAHPLSKTRKHLHLRPRPCRRRQRQRQLKQRRRQRIRTARQICSCVYVVFAAMVLLGVFLAEPVYVYLDVLPAQHCET